MERGQNENTVIFRFHTGAEKNHRRTSFPVGWTKTNANVHICIDAVCTRRVYVDLDLATHTVFNCTGVLPRPWPTG